METENTAPKQYVSGEERAGEKDGIKGHRQVDVSEFLKGQRKRLNLTAKFDSENTKVGTQLIQKSQRRQKETEEIRKKRQEKCQNAACWPQEGRREKS